MRPGVTDIDSQLMADEGFRTSVYQDSEGFWTIGVGTCVDARKACGITMSEAMLLMENRLKAETIAIQEVLPWTGSLDPVRLGVLQNMAYQMGIEGLIEFHDFLRAMQDGDYTGAGAAGLESKWARTQSPARAARLMKQIETGEWE